jgi:hypothetical protein
MRSYGLSVGETAKVLDPLLYGVTGLLPLLDCLFNWLRWIRGELLLLAVVEYHRIIMRKKVVLYFNLRG